MKPKLALCNFLPDHKTLKRFALENGFDGVDWSFEIGEFPLKPADESKWVKGLRELAPLDIRYHCPFKKVDIGHESPDRAKAAANLFRRIIHLTARAGGRYLTLHVGLGHDTTQILSWQRTVENLRELVRFGAERNVTVCLENLAVGWTSKPNLFEKLIRKTGAGVTLDIGHAFVCESVLTQYYGVEDFLSPHGGRVFNAHVYHAEIPGVGHKPPDRLEDLDQRLRMLMSAKCDWWTLELREIRGLLQTKKIVDEFFEKFKGEIADENHTRTAGRPWGPVL